MAAPLRKAPALTALMHAARENDVQKIVALVQNNNADMTATDELGRSALLQALEAGHEEAALMLIFHGSDTGYCRPPKNETPLIIACRKNMTLAIERLVTVKAPLDAQDNDGNTGLMKALENANGWAACRLVGAGADFDTIKNKKEESAWRIAHQHLDHDDLGFFKEQVRQKREGTAQTRAHELRENIQSATILNHPLKPMKRLTLRKSPGTTPPEP